MDDGALDALHQDIEQLMGARAPAPAGPLTTARAHADALLATSPAAAGESLVAAALAALSVGSGMTAHEARRLARRAHELCGADPLRVALLALADPLPLRLPLDSALRSHVTLLAGLADVSAVAVWRLNDGAPKLVTYDGSLPAMRTAAAVENVLRGDMNTQPVALVRAFGEPVALLVWKAGKRAEATARVLAERSSATLGPAFERASVLEGTIAQHAALARSAERRLGRVALDLHDGPLQDIALLRGELAALESTLAPALADAGGAPGAASPLERLGDAQAIAEAAEAELRELASSTETASFTGRSLGEALRGAARAFALRSGIEPTVELAGTDEELTSIERNAVLRVVGEALANVREHSGARTVAVRVTVGPGSVEASVRDDGRGFDVGRTLPAAARRGSLGLLGMIERIGQLDGTCEVLATPGGGTTVALSFPRVFAQSAVPLRAAG